MTLARFSASSLDNMALRILDLAATVRHIANICRENEVEDLSLHVNKVHEWIGHLEEWAHEGVGKLETDLIKSRAKQRAEQLLPARIALGSLGTTPIRKVNKPVKPAKPKP